jgi:hypothetical protein
MATEVRDGEGAIASTRDACATPSQLRLSTKERAQHHVTIPNHDPLKVGTLAGILNEVAGHLEISRDELIQQLFG